MRDVRLMFRQLRYEQLTFWRNPVGAVLTIVFSVVFLVLTSVGSANSRLKVLGGVRQIQYYAPGFMAYGVMSACFTTLAISLVFRRESGLLKRLRLSPLPTWVMVGGLFLSSIVVAGLQVIVLLAVGRVAFDLVLPTNLLALAVALALGAVCFTSLGIAVSALAPNQDTAPPIVNLAFFILLFLSGLWFPLRPGSGLAKFSDWFPVRHLILAAYAPFDPRLPAWSTRDLRVLLIWTVVGAWIATRRFRWAPSRR